MAAYIASSGLSCIFVVELGETGSPAHCDDTTGPTTQTILLVSGFALNSHTIVRQGARSRVGQGRAAEGAGAGGRAGQADFRDQGLLVGVGTG